MNRYTDDGSPQILSGHAEFALVAQLRSAMHYCSRRTDNCQINDIPERRR
jgi:hypothetical protein